VEETPREEKEGGGKKIMVERFEEEIVFGRLERKEVRYLLTTLDATQTGVYLRRVMANVFEYMVQHDCDFVIKSAKPLGKKEAEACKT